MLGNGIKQTTTTTGTGNLTLAAVTGYPKLADVVPLTFPVSYGLIDSSGLLIEEGIGHLADATTFVRATVTATYGGGVYSGGPVSTSTPTAANLAGTTTLIVTPNAATIESMLPTIDKISSGVSRFVASSGRTMTTTTVTPSTLRVYYMPFLLKTAAEVISLMASVNTAGSAGTVARLGIYACTEGGYMGPLLVSTGDLDVSTTGQKVGTLSSPISLPAGWYFVAFVASGAVTVTAFTTGTGAMLGGNPFGFNSSLAPIDMRYETAAAAVLPTAPSQATTALTVNTHNPAVFLGVQ